MEYLTANILGAIPVLFILLRRPDLARPMITIGLLAMPLTFFDLLYVPDYWVPKTLFEIPLGIEGFIFSFEAGALSTGIFAYVTNKKFRRVKKRLNYTTLLPLLVVLPVAYLFSLFAPINIAISMYAGMVAGILAFIFLRSGSAMNTLVTALSFTSVYAAALFVWAGIFPDTAAWFTLTNLPRLFILNVPIYEIIFGALFAAFWGNLYPHIFGYRAVDRAAKRRPASKPAVA